MVRLRAADFREPLHDSLDPGRVDHRFQRVAFGLI
jgi:hypothetical protein